MSTIYRMRGRSWLEVRGWRAWSGRSGGGALGASARERMPDLSSVILGLVPMGANLVLTVMIASDSSWS
ncbi:hypothetical protein CO650_26070 [Rhizobium phaseoli]|nr:hypothetical protein CO650_26070 [Rhizobium phaseoli]